MTSPRLGEWPDKPPKSHHLIAIIRSLAEHSELVFWSEHAFDRLKGRDSRSDGRLNDIVALRVLRTGDIDGRVRCGENKGEWIVKVIGPFSHEQGSRNVGVITAVLNTDSLFVMSVEWEDRR